MWKDPKAGHSVLDELVEQEPELHHYTTYGGIRGILETNTLWATHFRATNDRTEFRLLHDLLTNEVRNQLEPIFNKLAREDSWFREQASRVSGSIEQHLIDHTLGMVDSMYHFDIGDPASDLSSKSLDDGAFITCFCAHNADTDYVKRNGLLSQWRGYTSVTKYCVVFDTRRLVELARREVDHHLLRFMTFDRVVYADDKLPADDEYQDLAEFAATKIQSVVSRASVNYTVRSKAFDRLGPFLSFLACATRTKHASFSEEREIRIVVVRGGPELIRKARLARIKLEPRRPKTLKSRVRDGNSVHYVALFDELKLSLPVKRIIVGPSNHQQKDLELLRSFVPASIPIELSAIPFVGS